jgi:hypothetical protein
MTTYPDITIDQHLENLLIGLKRHVQSIDKSVLMFYDNGRVFNLQNRRAILKKDLMSYDQFCNRFQEICDQGHEWINLSGNGFWLGLSIHYE